MRTDVSWVNVGNSYIYPNRIGWIDVLIAWTSKYLNFNTTIWTTWYWIRDNAWSMEFKDSSWAWTTFASWTGTWDVHWNWDTLWVKKTLGSIDNYDIGFITNNTERLTITKAWVSNFTGTLKVNNNNVATEDFAVAMALVFG